MLSKALILTDATIFIYLIRSFSYFKTLYIGETVKAQRLQQWLNVFDNNNRFHTNVQLLYFCNIICNSASRILTYASYTFIIN